MYFSIQDAVSHGIVNPVWIYNRTDHLFHTTISCHYVLDNTIWLLLLYSHIGLGFTHHFTLHPLIWQNFSLISWLYFSTMWILWGRKCDYWVFHITHAKKGLPNHSSSTRDLKDFFSICDVENAILIYPPHSILSLLKTTILAKLWNKKPCSHFTKWQ